MAGSNPKKIRSHTDGVDPGRVPCRTLPGGTRIPAIGLGTFGSDRITADRVAATVEDAIRCGYRHIDCASVYHNEREIGIVLEGLFGSGLDRREFWITSKVWNDMHGSGKVIESCEKSLRDLRLDYLDLYLIHWPFPNYHAPGVPVQSRDPDARPYIHEEYMIAWRQMEQLVDRGLVRYIGTSNMTIPKLTRLLNDAVIRPAFNEMELHPHFQQPELFRFVTANGIQPIGFSPIGSPGRPYRDRTPADTVDIEDPVIIRIADRHGLSPAAVCIKWALQRGQIPIPFSTTRNNYLGNLQAVVAPPLSSEDMQLIVKTDRNCRLIKGQVFLWEKAKSWEDLWDPDGVLST